MSSTKISDLTSATSLTGAEEIPIVQTGTTKKTTVGDIKSENYSTTEQRVGTWIDGKPLYRRTIYKDNQTFSTSGSYVTTLQDIDNLCSINYWTGVIINGTARWSYIDGYINSNYYSGIQTEKTDTNNDVSINLWCKIGSVASGLFLCHILYTKTTD